MSRYSNPVPQIIQKRDGVLTPIAGAKKYFFETGTSTLKTIYADSSFTVAQENPVISDAQGRYTDDIFLDGVYAEVQEDENGVVLWTKDPVGVVESGQWTEWSNDATYNIPDIVKGSDGEYYRSITDDNQGNDPTTSPASWEQLSLGTVYNANVTYGENESVVDENDVLYISLVSGNAGNPLTDSTKWLIVGSSFYNLVVISASGTYDKPPGLRYVEVDARGAGAGGGGVDGQGAGTFGVGGAGGGGGRSIKRIAASALSASETVTIGAGGAGGAAGNNAGSNGGTTSFGAHCSANGGTGGGGDIAGGGRAKIGGAGGTATGGDINITGGVGHLGVAFGDANARVGSGNGGSCGDHHGATGVAADNNGGDATMPGAGGSGASVATEATNFAGGAGADGVIYLREYY